MINKLKRRKYKKKSYFQKSNTDDRVDLDFEIPHCDYKRVMLL